MKIDINLLYMQFKYHFTSTEHLEMKYVPFLVMYAVVLFLRLLFFSSWLCAIWICALYITALLVMRYVGRDAFYETAHKERYNFSCYISSML